METKRILRFYEKGVITSTEMFSLWKKYDLEPTEEFRELYLSWLQSIGKGSVTACIQA